MLQKRTFRTVNVTISILNEMKLNPTQFSRKIKTLRTINEHILLKYTFIHFPMSS
jgi:hypothetical protein